ncbi:MAG: hypothetical protein LBM69_02990 [Lachnospiraceae bacterium]|nr:hypothetical protein [Lachnospiraceae bacterium]
MNTTVKEFIYNLGKTASFKALIPLGFTAGYPVYEINGDHLFLKIPFYYSERIVIDRKYTGKSYVYPIRYLLSYNVADEKLAKFEDFSYDKRFSKVDFGKPIGEYPFATLTDVSKDKLTDSSEKLMELYDKMSKHIIDGDVFTAEDHSTFTLLLSELLHPAFVPIYQAIEPVFAKKYIAK